MGFCGRLWPITVVPIWGIWKIYLRTHCALHVFIYHAITASCKPLITHRLEKNAIILTWELKIYAVTYIMIQIVFFCTCVRILVRSTICLLNLRLFLPCYFGNQHNCAIFVLFWCNRIFLSFSGKLEKHNRCCFPSLKVVQKS